MSGERSDAAAKKSQGVEKVEVGIQIAYILAASMDSMHLGDIAKAAKLPPSKVHRFLVSLCRSELVEQDPVTGRYGLGGGAISLGLAAQGRLDEFRLGEHALQELQQKTKTSAAMFAWGNFGPTIVRRIDTFHALVVSLRLGSTVSVLNSAAGRVFAAFLPGASVDPIIQRELDADTRPTAHGRELTMAQFQDLLEGIRKRKVAEVRGDFMHGFDGMSSPVFDCNGAMVMALGLLGPSGFFASENGVRHRETLVSVAERLSARLGAPRA